ncbi:MAG TPA: peptide ABC transporter substrate-binding protein [Chloroflexota bacterium]|nr:peptide ABC transporter substrate-binding protein [Chloroflexota bacterium]
MRRILATTLLLSLVSVLFGGTSLQAQSPKTVTVALAREPDRLYNPATLAGQLVANLVFDPLVGLDDQMNPYPVLAATIPSADNQLVRLSGDGADRRLIVTMPLKQDVTWSDGEPFNADDVVYTWQLMMNPQSGFDTTVEDKLKNVDKVDDYTVRFTYLSGAEARAFDPERYKNQGSEPVIDPLYMFGLYDAPAIYPRHKVREIIGDDPRHSRQIDAVASSDFARNPTGTGPFVLASWEAGTALTFSSRGVALAQRMAKPAFDNVVFRILPDKNDSLTALSQGQIQVVAQDSIDAADGPVLDTLPGTQAHYTAGNAWEHLTFNLDNPILTDPNVRQAIAFGLNRAAINDAILFGKADVATSQVPSWSWAYDSNLVPYEYNPSRAEQLLDRAGWARSGSDGIRTKNGQRLSLGYWSTPAPFRPGLMAMVKDQLAQIGVELNVDSFPSSTLFATSGPTPQALVSRTFDVVEFAWLDSYDPGSDAVYNMHSGSIPTKANGYQGGNYAGYKNPRSDVLLDQLQRSLDPNFRRTALQEAQTIWQTDLPVLPLFLRPITTATSTRLTNFRPTPAPAGETWNIEQWDLAATP